MMADFTAPASNAGSVHEGAFPVKAAIVLALAALSDWLFYGHGIGISAAIFAVAVACGSTAYVEIGSRLMPIILETQKVTLAGFRILDSRGVVIAGRDEVGQSLAHIEEVATALRGQYRAVLRIRKPDKPPPPIYSISRGVGVHVFSAMPVIVNNRVAGVIYTSRTPSNIFDHLYQERGKFILAALAVVFATIIIGLVFSRTITRPMRELVDRAARISRGDRDAFRPLAHYGTREFAQLSHSFLDMAEQLSRRSDYIATFSAHLTHELKSPLTSIKGAAELLLDSLQSKSDTLTRMEQKNFISNILGDTGRLEAMTQRLRELARAETAPQNEHTELSQVIGGLKSRFPKNLNSAIAVLLEQITFAPHAIASKGGIPNPSAKDG